MAPKTNPIVAISPKPPGANAKNIVSGSWFENGINKTVDIKENNNKITKITMPCNRSFNRATMFIWGNRIPRLDPSNQSTNINVIEGI